jgi:citrate/tricarballylate utilization protein
MQLADPVNEAERVMTICNACRYCEGFCAVFPAMELGLQFTTADLNYLANLCHNCSECYYACQYAPPHEFAVNVPRTLAEIRALSYEQYAWPRAMAKMFQRNGWAMAWVLGLSVVFSIISAAGAGRLGSRTGAGFYDVIPHEAMVGVFGLLAVIAVAVLAAGFVAFWRESGGSLRSLANFTVFRTAVKESLTLRYLGQNGMGCAYSDEQHSDARRRFHHMTFYGFLSCCGSTTVAAIYHYTGSPAPYGYLSLPVVLGTVGGIGLLIGPAGLYRLKRRRDPAIADPKQEGMDQAFLAMLFLSSFTGLLLLAFRETSAMGPLLVLHLGTVLALFLAFPYGKFVHGVYRFAALVRYAAEREIRQIGV